MRSISTGDANEEVEYDPRFDLDLCAVGDSKWPIGVASLVHGLGLRFRFVMPTDSVTHYTWEQMPKEQVSGAGAMVRFVRDLARVPRLQEDLTQAIADGVHDFLEPIGVEVWIRARHLCMELRGSGSRARLVTEARRGESLSAAPSGSGSAPKRPAR